MSAVLVLFLPLLGSLLAGFFGSYFGVSFARLITVICVCLAAILSWILLFSGILGMEFSDGVFSGKNDYIVPLARWIDVGSFQAFWSLRVDMLTRVMLVVVTSVSALVHIYSLGYMSSDPHQPRFLSYLSLFTFAMLSLVTADNLLQLFFGWEGVGLASYLLIGFWYKKSSANAAAMKAFIVNRVGDFGLLLGILALFSVFGTIDFSLIFASVSDHTDAVISIFGISFHALTLICLLLFMGAMGKSAQFLLHTWLPDAMEGPTPVSALIHAATMVTAGVFLVARFSPVFEYAPFALSVVCFFGITTAFFAATVGLVQNDIKRVIAYSTCSQLGYMFAAMGVGAYGVGMFHLFTHAFFKALLFLGAGSVIHGVSDEQDIRRMGGLYRHLPQTWVMMVIGTISLTGFPIITAGYYSKDAIIEALYMSPLIFSGYGFWILSLSAALTSFYSWRLMFMVFHGRSRLSGDVSSHLHESPFVMLFPLYVLAIGSLASGYVFKDFFIGVYESYFWGVSLFRGSENTIVHDLHLAPLWVKWTPFVMMVMGFLVAWIFYIRRPDVPESLALRHNILYRFLLNKWYFDEVYDFLFVGPVRRLGRFLWRRGDGWLIDGFGPDGISGFIYSMTLRSVRFHSGYVYHYAFAMLIGAVVILTLFIVLES